MSETIEPNADGPGDDMEPFEAQFEATANGASAETDAETEAVVEEVAEAVVAEELVDVALAEEAIEAEEDADDASRSGVADAELLEIEEIPESEPSPYDRPGRWYVVHTYAGYENKVKSNRASRVRSMNVEDRIYEVVIAMEDVIEFKNGRKVVVQKKVFPGYLLVRMGLDDDAWYVVRNTPGVTGFVGSGAKPTHLRGRKSRTSSAPARRSKVPRPRRRCARGSSTRSPNRCASSPARSPTSTA